MHPISKLGVITFDFCVSFSFDIKTKILPLTLRRFLSLYQALDFPMKATLAATLISLTVAKNRINDHLGL